MKKTVWIAFVLLIAVVSAGAGMHKFYVAVFQMEHVPEKKLVQMTSRIFIDDLEAALNKKYGKTFYLGSVKELPDADDYIRKYFSEKMQVNVNGKLKPVKFLGREIEDDIFIGYYTFPAEGKIKSVEMRNTVLMESFSDQQNIVHAHINRNRKSLLLTNGNEQGILQF